MRIPSPHREMYTPDGAADAARNEWRLGARSWSSRYYGGWRRWRKSDVSSAGCPPRKLADPTCYARYARGASEGGPAPPLRTPRRVLLPRVRNRELEQVLAHAAGRSSRAIRGATVWSARRPVLWSAWAGASSAELMQAGRWRDPKTATGYTEAELGLSRGPRSPPGRHRVFLSSREASRHRAARRSRRPLL